MPRMLPYVVVLALVVAALAGCIAGALRPPRPDALPMGTPTVAPTRDIPPTAGATPSATAPAATATIALARPHTTAAPSPQAPTLAPSTPGAYPGPEVAVPYPPPEEGDGRDVTLLPMVVRPESEAEGATPGVPSIAAVAPAGFVQAHGRSLVLDGAPYYFVGVNASYLMLDYFPEREVEPIVRYLSETGGVNVIRLFFQPGKDLDRFERLLDIGRKYGIRFIVALQDFYFYKTQTWFDAHYKEEDLPHIRAVVPRFRDRPEVLMWELMNEPGCGPDDEPKGCQGHIYNWAAAVSAEIKELDPHHLVSVGTLSAEGTRYHTSTYKKMHELPTVDVISLHRYVGKTSRTEMRLSVELDKPIFVGEAWHRSYEKDRCEPVSKSALADRADKIAKDLKWSFEHGLAGYLLWQHDPGLVRKDDGERQWFCSEFSFLEGDPTYGVLREQLARMRAGVGVDLRAVDGN